MWGAVKHFKTGQRSHLGADATRMQATIFGAACIEKARSTLKKEKEEDDLGMFRVNCIIMKSIIRVL